MYPSPVVIFWKGYIACDPASAVHLDINLQAGCLDGGIPYQFLGFGVQGIDSGCGFRGAEDYLAAVSKFAGDILNHNLDCTRHSPECKGFPSPSTAGHGNQDVFFSAINLGADGKTHLFPLDGDYIGRIEGRSSRLCPFWNLTAEHGAFSAFRCLEGGETAVGQFHKDTVSGGPFEELVLLQDTLDHACGCGDFGLDSPDGDGLLRIPCTPCHCGQDGYCAY